MPQLISKRFKFDMGHRVLGLVHKKEDAIHGHSSEIEVCLETTSNKIYDTNKLTEQIKPIIDKIDHAFLIWDKDPLKNEILELAQMGDFEGKVIIMEENPTFENIMKFLYREIKKTLNIDSKFKLKVIYYATKNIRGEYYE